MEKLDQIILFIHIALGSVALVTFWIPAFSKKGGKIHRRSGVLYVACMYGVVVTAAVLSIINALTGNTDMALFLGFLTILSLNPLWHGTAVLKNKRTMKPGFRSLRLILESSVVLFGTFLLVYGIFVSNPGFRVLFIFFGFIGFTSIRDIVSVWKQDTYDWYRDHYSGLITSGIAAYTAFLAFGGRYLLQDILPGIWQVLPWILPTVIGATAIRLLNRYYRKKGLVA